MSFKIGFEKVSASKVCLPRKEFISEHRRLVGELRHPKKKELKNEAKDQSKELTEEEKK